MAVPHQTRPPVRQRDVTHAGQKRLGLQLDSLCEEPSGPGSQNIRQGIVDLIGLTKPDDIGIRVHGVSLSLRGPGRLDTRLDTPPSFHRRHPLPGIAQPLVLTVLCLTVAKTLSIGLLVRRWSQCSAGKS